MCVNCGTLYNQGYTVTGIGIEFACNICLNKWDINYESMLEQLDLIPLSQHRKHLIFTTMYNVNGIGYFFSVLCRCIPLPALCMHVVVLLGCSVA